MSQIQLEDSWKSRLLAEFSKPYMRNLKAFLTEELKNGKTVYPKGGEYFRALDLTPFDKVRLIIIGQDPYHGPGQAHGLCFSVRKEVPPPPSLVNIYKELQSDLDIPISRSGLLEAWAGQGVLLLNSVLTVEARRPHSHKGKGWEEFTDRIIALLNEERQRLVFLLWGRPAAEKAKSVDPKKHLILKAPHPSPFSADRGFFGCRHFSRANDYLKSHGLEPVDWSAHLSPDPVSAPSQTAAAKQKSAAPPARDFSEGKSLSPADLKAARIEAREQFEEAKQYEKKCREDLDSHIENSKKPANAEYRKYKETGDLVSKTEAEKKYREAEKLEERFKERLRQAKEDRKAAEREYVELRQRQE